MNRAQEVRQNRIREREEDRQKELALDQKTKTEVEVLFNWVLDLLEHPTYYNTKDEVILSESFKHKIRIGFHSDVSSGLTEKTFSNHTMEILAQKFEAEEGYTGYYSAGNGIESSSYVQIKIK